MDIKTHKVLVRIIEILYGRYGVYHKRNCKPMEHDVYHNKYLAEPERWHCNLCDRYVSGCNRSSHERNNVHKKKVEKKG